VDAAEHVWYLDLADDGDGVLVIFFLNKIRAVDKSQMYVSYKISWSKSSDNKQQSIFFNWTVEMLILGN